MSRLRTGVRGAIAWSAIVLLGATISTSAFAQASLSDLSNKEASKGLREALIEGARKAADELGKPDGFLGNAKVKIPLPSSLQRMESVMRNVGMGKQADDLVTTMNRAAEAAVPEAKPLLIAAVKRMTLQDAKGILSGPDDAATEYFRKITSDALTARFLPIVKQATSKVKLAETYNNFAGMASSFGLLDKKNANLDTYVTQKALDGLFLMMAEEEKTIRTNPVGAATDIVKKVFGAIGR
ncbi:MAG: DUF4197 domain-containing protein [Betaproteobacteria bacterium]